MSLGFALLLLLAVVGLAARGHLAGAGGGQTRHLPGDILLEYALLLMALGAVVMVPLVFVVFHRAREEPDSLPQRGNWMLRLFLTMMVFSVGFLVWAYIRHHHHHHPGSSNPLADLGAKLRQMAHPTHEPHFDLAPVIVVFSIAAVAAAALGFFYLRSRQNGTAEKRAAVALSDALDQSLDDLRSEADPRRAVIAAYARMERALAASGLPRQAAEAPLEYLTRVLRDLLRASAASVARLTALFERAKFSHHEIGSELKEEAIEALVAVRDELRLYA